MIAVVGDDKSSERARLIFGEPIDAHLEEDRSQLDFRRVFVSNKEVVGRPIGNAGIYPTAMIVKLILAQLLV